MRSLLLCIVVLMGVFTRSALASVGDPDDHAVVKGRIEDSETGKPVGWVQMLLDELSRGTTADENGLFEFKNVPEGTYTLKTFRVGYESFSRVINVPKADTLNLVIRLSSSPIIGSELVVEHTYAGSSGEAAVELSGSDLRTRLAGTVAETLKGSPGLSMRSMGPAPARPVLRGMGGDRLMLLEDGGRTGDLSNTSADHAVTIEPLNAERIEVIRGPKTLAYGSSTMGGLVNVIRNFIPDHPPEKIHGGASLQAESVNRGTSGGFVAGFPAGSFALHLDATYRRALDMHTPVGVLDNTDLTTYNGSLGISRPFEEGYIGIAVSHYNTSYGIPGGFVGAHPNGVDIQLYRNHAELQGQYTLHAANFSQLEGKARFTYLFQQEFERQDIVGIEFAVANANATFQSRTRNIGPFRNGLIGIWSQYRDFKTGGFAFTPFTTERSHAVFIYQEAVSDPFRLEVGVRGDARVVRPEEELETDIGFIRQRSFSGVSASVAGTVNFGHGFSGHLTTMRSVRTPSVEELFSQGPHLAAYSFDIGNPELGVEKGWGVEARTSFNRRGTYLDVTAFLNQFDDYIFLENTGEINVRTLLPVYRYEGASTTINGVEASIQLPLTTDFRIAGNASYVHGKNTATGEPLPLMPPLTGNIGVDYHIGSIVVGTSLRGTSRQDRLGAFEQPTDGYLVWDARFQVVFSGMRMLQTLDLVVQNITNATYRDHLSRVKSIMPEPGINAKVLYKVFF